MSGAIPNLSTTPDLVLTPDRQPDRDAERPPFLRAGPLEGSYSFFPIPGVPGWAAS